MWLVASMAAFASSVLVHAMLVRLVKRPGSVAAFVGVGGAIGAALIGYGILNYGFSPTVIAIALTYAFACEFYIFLFTLVGNSVSFGVMAKLVRRPLRPGEIAAYYRTENMVERRLEQLERANLIVADQSGFRLTPRGRGVARIFSLLRKSFCRPAL